MGVSAANHRRARGVVKERVEDLRAVTEVVEEGVGKPRAQERPQRDPRRPRRVGGDRLDHRANHGRDVHGQTLAVECCEETRQSLELNVSEELALTALTLRLERLVGSAD